MSTVVTSSARAENCPEPPSDFAQRALPILELNLSTTNLYRIHETTFGPLFFNRRSTSSTVFRFDASNDEFGVIYAAPSFAACMAETVIRERFERGSLPLVIEEAKLETRSISALGLSSPRALRLADFTQPLFSLGGNGLILSTGDYRVPNMWSSAVYAHPENVDGIYFVSRFAAEPCVAAYDRAGITVRGQAMRLMDAPELAPFLDKYHIGLV